HTAAERARHVETGSYLEPEPAEEASVQEGQADGDDLPTAQAPVVEKEVEAVAKAKEAPATAHTTAELMESLSGNPVDAPLCFTCGTKMRPSGSCYVCEGCGSTSGCS
ncbi:MAG: vitamin B12-dependent ribonucleotide reductase, partial [Propionibacteriales bacterium]|nr:vitamin B12-dependent ribonucleotide reductase [Propionibacteriales bacterium]